MFCLDCALIQVNIPVTISILLENMLLVVEDNFPEIPAELPLVKVLSGAES